MDNAFCMIMGGYILRGISVQRSCLPGTQIFAMSDANNTFTFSSQCHKFAISPSRAFEQHKHRLLWSNRLKKQDF